MSIANKFPEKVVIGKNILSYLAAFKLLKHKHKVVMIDDSECELGESFISTLTEFNVNFFKEWGADLNIDSYMHIDEYLEGKSEVIHIDGVSLFLSTCPYSNLMELLRKLPELFPIDFLERIPPREQFNLEFTSGIEKLAQHCYHYRSFDNISVADFEKYVPSILLEIHSEFYKVYLDSMQNTNNDNYTARVLAYLGQYKFHHVLTDKLNHLESLSLVINLVARKFTFKAKQLVHNLDEEFTRKSGLLKNANIEFWQFWRGKLAGLQLSTFEGVLRPKKVLYFGNKTEKLPFQFLGPKSIYYVFEYESKTAPDINIDPSGQEHTFLDLPDMGTHLPIVRIIQTKEGIIRASFLAKTEDGGKCEFYAKQVKKVLIRALKRSFSSSLDWESVDWVGPKALADQFPGDLPKKRRLGKLSTFKGLRSHKLLVSLERGPEEKNIIQGIEYWGPLQNQGLGLFSVLMDLKNNT
jgi:hypothetical protein